MKMLSASRTGARALIKRPVLAYVVEISNELLISTLQEQSKTEIMAPSTELGDIVRVASGPCHFHSKDQIVH